MILSLLLLYRADGTLANASRENMCTGVRRSENCHLQRGRSILRKNKCVREVLLVSLELDFYQMMIQPMRDELTDVGFRELRSAEAVDEVMAHKTGTTLFVVNSVCGCAGGIARPAVSMALESDRLPDRLVTVFAGQDKDATERARSFFTDMPPSSPSMFLFKDGELVGVLHRGDIEGSRAEIVAGRLVDMFDKYCAPKTN